jgi:3-deoxy-D-manno-octulosonic-acid transferase
MWSLFYQFGIAILSSIYRLIGLFQAKAKSFNQGRKNIFKKLEKAVENRESKLVWVHAASLGEFEQGRPLIEQLKKEYPDIFILLTFFSPSGYNIRKQYEYADYVCYLPWDTLSNARKFVTIINPSLAVFIKYEFWHNYINTLHQNNIPLISISTILRPEQIYFKWYGKYFRNSLKKVDHYFVQNTNTANLLESIGINEISIAGDTRFDRVKNIQESAADIVQVKNFKGNRKLLIAGSVWKEDMEVLNPFINIANNDWCFIIAPHEINEQVLLKIEADISGGTIRFSKIGDNTNLLETNVIIIDNIGILSTLYRYADFAFIGGAFGAGLHNIIEASVNGIPVFFGNRNFIKFKEAVDLIQLGAAFPVSNFDSFKQLIDQFQDVNQYELVNQVALNYISQNIGATEKIMAYCRTKISGT